MNDLKLIRRKLLAARQLLDRRNQELAQAQANVHVADGAIQALEDLLRELENVENSQADDSGAS